MKAETKIQLINAELLTMLDHVEKTNDSDGDLLETMIDRVISLTELINKDVPLPACHVDTNAWEDKK